MKKSKARYALQTDMKSAYVEKDRHYYHVDASNMVLGRVASEVVRILMGKHKADYTPTALSGDNVVVTNVKDIRLTGKKMTDKIYTRYSGYPGGLRSETAGDVYKKDPCELVRRAVKGMLPDNKLKIERLKRLFVYTEKHDLPSSVKLISYGIK